MNLDALKEILTNQVEILEESAKNNASDSSTVIGIAKYVVGNGYDKLSENQKYHFDKSIRHLIENVRCEGYQGPFGEDDNECQAILDDNDLVDCYRDDNFMCENCKGDAASDAHSRDRFMED